MGPFDRVGNRLLPGRLPSSVLRQTGPGPSFPTPKPAACTPAGRGISAAKLPVASGNPTPRLESPRQRCWDAGHTQALYSGGRKGGHLPGGPPRVKVAMITMNANNKKTSSPSNRRSSRRFTVTGPARIECRKGTLGLGQSLNLNTLDIAETGVRLVRKEVVAKGQEMEVLVEGGGIVRPIKRMAR